MEKTKEEILKGLRDKFDEQTSAEMPEDLKEFSEQVDFNFTYKTHEFVMVPESEMDAFKNRMKNLLELAFDEGVKFGSKK